MNTFIPSGKALVKHALEIGAMELVPEGRELKNGRRSPHFWNSGLFKTGADLDILASVYASAIAKSPIVDGVEVVYGPAYKGIPLAATVAMKLSSEYGVEVEYCFDRKEKKNYADGGKLVGADLSGKNVLMLDDVITDGSTKDEATTIIRGHNGTLIGLAVGFDRNEWSNEARMDQSALLRFGETYDVETIAAAKTGDLLQVLEESENPMHKDAALLVAGYVTQYGTRASR